MCVCVAAISQIACSWYATETTNRAFFFPVPQQGRSAIWAEICCFYLQHLKWQLLTEQTTKAERRHDRRFTGLHCTDDGRTHLLRRINQRQRNSEFTLNYIMVNVIANEHAVRTSLTSNMNVTNCRRHGWVNATVRWVFLCTCAHIVSLRIGTLLSLACCLGILS